MTSLERIKRLIKVPRGAPCLGGEGGRHSLGSLLGSPSLRDASLPPLNTYALPLHPRRSLNSHSAPLHYTTPSPAPPSTPSTKPLPSLSSHSLHYTMPLTCSTFLSFHHQASPLSTRLPPPYPTVTLHPTALTQFHPTFHHPSSPNTHP